MTGVPSNRNEEVKHWTVDEFVAAASNVLETGKSDFLQAFDGRWVGLLASPGTNDAKHAALGLSVLPAGCITPTHSHEAEEVAVVIEGKGSIEINRSLIAVKAGSVVFTPSNLPHRTKAEDSLTIFWLYSPAGSEQRWISGEPARKDER